MTAASIDLVDARSLVEARLGRRPQDMLEAAVVLEAWAGVPAEAALATASATMSAESALPQPSVGRLPRHRQRDGVVLEGAGFLIAVVAIACWASPLTRAAGLHAVEVALTVALPLTLAAQRALGQRFLDRERGVEQLARHRLALLAGAVGVLLVLALALGTGGLLAGLLTITWTGGTVLMRRRWPAAYVAIILAATAALLGGLAPLTVVAAAAAATAVAVALALRAPAPPAAHRPHVLVTPTLVAGATGVGLGAMLVLDRSVTWTDGAAPALALVPSTLAALLAGHHLRHLELSIPSALRGVPAAQPARRLGSKPVRILASASGRLVGLSARLSIPLLWASPWSGEAGVLAGFALVALAAMLVGLLDSLGRAGWALAAVACGALAEAAIRAGSVDPFAGAGLVAGGLVVTLIVLPPVVTRLGRPATTLATALWIR
ncbi:MAG TPA: hypothetical protein VI318_22040 [Baekduia sp.]